MDGYTSALELAKELDEFLASAQREVLLSCCENVSEPMQIANLCASLSEKSEDMYDNKERQGFSSEHIGLKHFVLMQMIVIGGATIRKWLADKAAEYEAVDAEYNKGKE